MARSMWALAALLVVLGCQDSAQKVPAAEKGDRAGAQAGSIDAIKRDVAESLGEGRTIQPRALATGHVVAEVPESSVVLARRNPDGTIERVCVDSSAAAEEFLVAPSTPARGE